MGLGWLTSPLPTLNRGTFFVLTIFQIEDLNQITISTGIHLVELNEMGVVFDAFEQ